MNLGRALGPEDYHLLRSEQRLRRDYPETTATLIIGLISDTHIPSRARRLPDALLHIFSGVDLILHAGDVVTPEVLDDLSEIAPVKGVMGNCDLFELKTRLTDTLEVAAEGVSIGMIHDSGHSAKRRQRMREMFPGCRVVVFGHSHVPMVDDDGDLLLVNPGTPTDPRWGSQLTSVAILEVSGAQPRAELVILD